ncbi:class I adenylate-forming enzyme family protein [Streptomyces sp. NPDC091271]|uniref:class I adenylate-forming enzyme family protein n=1 Tax=Streptomyces sp. NPDC091271 TaxID=3365980 RepID=UPI003804D368
MSRGITTLGARIAEAAVEHAGALMVFHTPEGTRELTLTDVHEQATAAAAGLARLGVEPGDVVVVQLPNGVESLVAHAAVLLRGAVLLPVVTIYGPRELGFILRQSGAKALIATADRVRERAAGETDDGLRVVAVGDRSPGTGAVPWSALAASPSGPGAPSAAADDIAALVYTSGTTGDPKGVQHTHRSLLSEIGNMPGSRQGLVYLNPFPPGHIASLGVMLRALILGTPTVFMQKWDPEAALDLISAHGVTASAGVPFHLAGLLDAAERSGRSLGTLCDYLVGAASVAPVLVERAHRAGIAAYRAYGSSEHPTITSGRPDDPVAWRAYTDGRPMPGCEIRIVGPDGRDVPPGQDGEVFSRGPELFAGYRDASLNEGALAEGGWLRTGDAGRVDADGCLTITDRLKDIIVRGGEKISSKEVEDVLASHPSVAEAAAVAEPDARYGERVCAFVVPRDGTEFGLSDVAAHFAASGLARQKTPERLIVVRELPRTPAGKILKQQLRVRLNEASEGATG